MLQPSRGPEIRGRLTNCSAAFTIFAFTLHLTPAQPARVFLQLNLEMLSRSILRSAFRALPRTIPRPLPRTPFPRVFQEPTPLIVRRFASRGPRIKHYRYNPEEVQRAKPLLTGEQIRNGFRHPGTKVLAVVVLGGGIYFYVSHLETVPVSGRRRFNCYSEDRVEEEGKMMYNMIMQQDRDAILPAWDPRTRMVQRVMNKLIPASGLEHVNVGLL